MWLLISLLVLSVLIFFHELGHFLVARIFGVKVEVFSIGFGKIIASKTINGTTYALSALPLGGYVKMKGQDDFDPSKKSADPDSYTAKAPWQKICILFAGSGANVLLAFFIYAAIGFFGATAMLPVVGEAIEGSPAQSAGLLEGDKITAIDGKKIKSWRDLSDEIAAKVGERGEDSRAIEIIFERGGVEQKATLTPQIREGKNIFGESVKQGFIGIKAKGEVGKITYALSEIPAFALGETIFGAKIIVLGLQKLIVGILPINQLGGPIAIVQAISQAHDIGLVALLSLSALISINLGILNLLPVPALDGGHIVFTAYEWVSRRAISLKTMLRLTVFGWILLGALMLLGVYNDISRLITQ